MKETHDKEKESVHIKNKIKKFFLLNDDNFFSGLFSKEFALRMFVYFVLGMLAMIPVLSQNETPSQEVLDKLPPGFIGPYIPIYIFTIIAVAVAIYLLVLCYVNNLSKKFAWFNISFVIFNLIFYLDFDFWGLRPFYMGAMLILLLSAMLANMLVSPKYENDKKLKHLIIGGFFFTIIGLALRYGDLFDKTEGLILFSKIIISLGIVIVYLFSIVSLFDYLVISKDNGGFSLFAKILYTLFIIILVFALPFLLKHFWEVDEGVLTNIIIPIYASCVAGIITLAGVGWTIKINSKDRNADIKRIEDERKEEERKKLVPYLRLTKPEDAEGCVYTKMGQGLDLNNKEDVAKLKGRPYAYCYLIGDFPIKNISKDNIIINAIYVEGTKFQLDGDVLVESGKSIWVKTTQKSCVLSPNLLKEIKLSCLDLLGNEYIFNCELSPILNHSYYAFEQEVDGITYRGYNIEYNITRIGLPYISEK